MVEYIVILGAVTIGLAGSIVAVAPALVRAYERTQALMYLPFP